ncbi:PREDICTED: transcriptional regulator SUPERMAN-like [Camelina sativa]|uniref:Transcriptional regulator SUPERMAN-like n=1 Tax=Camelina sativa TaxID=90675 RepID=A0ABM0W738_CAMSA|nr:PREDICTED: transcriptional regulator SUPERMAN-like [Camelina sativa]
MNNRGKQIDSGSGSGSGSGDKRRTYDCNICKRGFTNPQALGGHNNIHSRRERNLSSFSPSNSFPFSLPLPSQSPSSSINFTNPNDNNNPSPYLPTIDSYHHQVSQPPINPSHNTQYFGSSSPRGGGRFAQGESHGLDLSLGLGYMMNEDDDTHQSPQETGGSEPQDDDLDLDLRLGRHRHH